MVDKDNYLLELCRYVVLNPVRAYLVELPDHWQWGSYGPTAGTSKVPECLTVDWLLSLFGVDRKIAQQQYCKFDRADINKKLPWDEHEGRVILGSKEFVGQFKELLTEKEKLKEIPRQQRYIGRPDLKDIFFDSGDLTKAIRNKNIYEAHVKYGYNLKEIADHLGLHYSTVSKIIRRILE